MQLQRQIVVAIQTKTMDKESFLRIKEKITLQEKFTNLLMASRNSPVVALEEKERCLIQLDVDSSRQRMITRKKKSLIVLKTTTVFHPPIFLSLLQPLSTVRVSVVTKIYKQ